MTTFQKIVGMSLLIIALSLGYYFVFFLPTKEKIKQEQNVLSEKQYSACMEAGYQQYQKDRDKTCISGGLHTGCILPSDVEKLMTQNLQAYKDFCEQYKK